ncbi:hypothetical protein NL533_33890, partial [Klebsiella pneumoniae]|nr:hypothetical protein [Klebsiella pneumoniae]
VKETGVERSDLHIAEIHEHSTALAAILTLASEPRYDTLVGRPDVTGEPAPPTGMALDANPRSVQPVRRLAPLTNLPHVAAAFQ